LRLIRLLCRTLLCELVRYSHFLSSLKNWNNLSINNWLHGVIRVLLVRELIFIEWGFPFPLVSVPTYKLSLCHTPIKPGLLGFFGNWCFCMWVAWPHVQEVHIIFFIFWSWFLLFSRKLKKKMMAFWIAHVASGRCSCPSSNNM